MSKEFLVELESALRGKKPGDPMKGRPQYLAQQMAKVIGATEKYKPPLNAGRMRALVEDFKGFGDSIIHTAKQQASKAERRMLSTAKLPVEEPAQQIRPRRVRPETKVDFVAERRWDAALRYRQRQIDNWYWREGMMRATPEPCKCGASESRPHVIIQVQSKGGRVDAMCPLCFWARMHIAFPSIFPSTDEERDRFLESATKWEHVRPRD